MKYQLYCIFEKPTDRTIVIPLASGGHAFHVVEKEGLCAVFSAISNREAAYEISEIRSYSTVIEWFFHQVAVVPFRFGTILDEYADVERLLEKRAEHYKKMLSELGSCAEMGIRAIIDRQEIPLEGLCCAKFPALGSPYPGKHYLSSRRVHYRTETRLAQITEKVTERYRAAFAGMYKICKSEITKAAVGKERRQTIMVSIYFLVPRDILARFRQTFLDKVSDDADKVLLSGPWPPYNFVLPDDSPPK